MTFLLLDCVLADRLPNKLKQHTTPCCVLYSGSRERKSRREVDEVEGDDIVWARHDTASLKP